MDALRFQGKTRDFNHLQMRMLVHGLSFEAKTGMYMTDPRKIGGSCYSICKNEFGFKGNKAKVLEQLTAMVQAIGNPKVAL